jgi:FkbM family methyltransferase
LRSPNLSAIWRNVRSQGQPFRYLTALLLRRTGLNQFFWVERAGFRIPFDDSSLSLAMWIDNDLGRHDQQFFEKMLRPGDCVIDVGANIGVLSLAASRLVTEHGHVYAVEAHPLTASKLRRNIELNSRQNITVFQVALGERAGMVQFADRRDDDSQNAVVFDENKSIKLPMLRLDDLPIQTGEIALVKIDTEGYEKFVLAGAKKTLERTRCVYFEAYELLFRRFGYSFTDLTAIFAKFDFEVYRFTPPGLLNRVDKAFLPTSLENLVAMRKRDVIQLDSLHEGA